MTGAYRLTPRASEGFRHIILYVEERFGPEVAERVVGDLERAFEQVAANPSIGHRRKDLTGDERVLFWSVGPTLIAYRSNTEWVEVLFVERGDLDWDRTPIPMRRSAPVRERGPLASRLSSSPPVRPIHAAWISSTNQQAGRAAGAGIPALGPALCIRS